jgi:hypothetical protein
MRNMFAQSSLRSDDIAGPGGPDPLILVLDSVRIWVWVPLLAYPKNKKWKI